MERNLVVHNGEIPQEPDTIRFVCISDTHNETRGLEVPPGDVLLHSGDFTGIGKVKEIEHFNRFLARQSHPIKIVIAGNQETVFDLQNFEKIRKKYNLPKDYDPVAARNTLSGCIYIQDETIHVHGYELYGTPWIPRDRGFKAFWMKTGTLGPIWENIPDTTEILMTHTPPFGLWDTNLSGDHCGDADLTSVVMQKRPLVHLFGHVHEGYGVAHQNDITFINAAIYNKFNPGQQIPFVFDLPKRRN